MLTFSSILIPWPPIRLILEKGRIFYSSNQAKVDQRTPHVPPEGSITSACPKKTIEGEATQMKRRWNNRELCTNLLRIQFKFLQAEKNRKRHKFRTINLTLFLPAKIASSTTSQQVFPGQSRHHKMINRPSSPLYYYHFKTSTLPRHPTINT